MTDTRLPERRIVDAAMKLAAERNWPRVSLLDIAAAAGVSLADLRRSFGSKGEIVAAFARRIDDEILSRATVPPAGQSARDTVFEVVMSRFDALTPYRFALRSIHAAAGADPALLKSLLASQTWMLNAAGVATDGVDGGIRVAGLASVYASVFATWLDDDDPGLARTMAALDRRLRRGERMLSSLDEVSAALRRVAGMFAPGGGSRPAATEDASAASKPAGDAAAPAV